MTEQTDEEDVADLRRCGGLVRWDGGSGARARNGSSVGNCHNRGGGEAWRHSMQEATIVASRPRLYMTSKALPMFVPK